MSAAAKFWCGRHGGPAFQKWLDTVALSKDTVALSKDTVALSGSRIVSMKLLTLDCKLN